MTMITHHRNVRRVKVDLRNIAMKQMTQEVHLLRKLQNQFEVVIREMSNLT